MPDSGALIDLVLKLVTGVLALATALLGFVRVRHEITRAAQSASPSADARELARAAVARAHRLNKLLLGVLFTIAALTVAILLWSPRPDHVLASFLTKRDPVVFASSRNDHYELARVLHNQQVLQEETQLSKEIGAAKRTFYVLANTGGNMFRAHGQDFLDAAARGVNIEVILSDYGPENADNFDRFARTVGEDPAGVRGDVKTISTLVRQLIDKTRADREKYKGSIELRWLSKPLFYTAWIRDGATAEGMAHMSVHMYRSKNEWPSFRFGRDAQEMVASLRLDYESLWQSAKQQQPDTQS